MTALSEADVAKIVQQSVQKNNQSLQDTMKEMLKESLADLKRSQTESADSQIREIKKLKLDEPRRFKKKANEDQFRFNAKLQDVIDEAKSSVHSDGLQKVKESLEKGETLLSERQKHILLADKSEFGWVTVHEYKKSEIADDSEDEKKMYKAEARAKAHAKQTSARSTKIAVGAVPRKDPAIGEFSSKQFNERIPAGRQIPTLDSRYKTQVKPGFCYHCGKPGHWRAQCPTALRGAGSTR